MNEIDSLVEQALNPQSDIDCEYWKNYVEDLEAVKTGYFPKLGIGHIDAKIILVFDRPGHNFQSNERGWTLEELKSDIRRFRKLNMQNHFLSWDGGRKFLDIIGTQTFSKDMKELTLLELYEKLKDKVYIADCCKLPSKNDNDFKCNRPFLKKELEILNPDIIIATGDSAREEVQKILDVKIAEGKKISKTKPEDWTESNGIYYLSLVHPSRAQTHIKENDYRDYLEKRLEALPYDFTQM